MHYLYDIWINWCDGEEDGYNIYPYHEWRKDDEILMIDQVPVLYINDDLFHQIENSLLPLPEKLLSTIYKKTYVRKGYGRRVLAYSCIVTDNKDVLLFDTLGFKRPYRKSRLIPRQERQVYEICEKMKQRNFALNTSQTDLKNAPWQLSESQIIGLTRRERYLKKILFISLMYLKKTDNKQEISYWLSEWKGKNALSPMRDLTIDEIWQHLYDEIEGGWTPAHEKFLSQLVRIYPILQHEWKRENDKQRNMENQK